MTSATVTGKGQITIPAQVRRDLSLTSGSRVNFFPTDNGYELVPATGSVRSLKGVIPAPATPVSLEQMDAAISEAIAERARSDRS